MQNYLFKLVTCYLHILRFIALHGIYYVVDFILFSLENDDMESSKRCVKLLSFIFIIRCLTKSDIIRVLELNQIIIWFYFMYINYVY